MTNARELNTINRFSAALEESARSDKTAAAKEFRAEALKLSKERAAWEKAFGGKKKIEEADKYFTVRTVEAETEAQRIIAAANDVISKGNSELQGRALALESSQTTNDRWSTSLTKRAAGLEGRSSELAASKLTLDTREKELDGREAGIVIREGKATGREIAVKAREDYYAAAP